MSIFSKIFNPIGNAFKSVVNPIYNSVLKPSYEGLIKPAYEQVAKPVLQAASPILSSVAPMAGSLIGARFGGPQGAMMGGQVGGMAGGLFDKLFGGGSGGGGEQAAPQMPVQGPQGYDGSQMPPGLSDMMQRYGNQATNFANRYMPDSFRGHNFGNIGQAAGDYLGERMGSFGDRFGLGDMGRNFGSFLGRQANPYVQQAVPSFMRDVPMGDIGGYAQRGMSDYMSRRMGWNANQGNQYQQPDMGYDLPNAGNQVGGNTSDNWNYEQPFGAPPPLPPRDHAPFRGAPPPLPPRDHAPYRGGYSNPIDEMNQRFASGTPILRRTPPPLPPRPRSYSNPIDEMKAKFASGKPVLRNAGPGGRVRYSDLLPPPPVRPRDQLMNDIKSRANARNSRLGMSL